MFSRLLLTILLFFCVQSIAIAKVTITKRTASVKVTAPDGSSNVVAPAEPLSTVPEGTIIEALRGDTSDIVYVDINFKGQRVHLTQGKAIQLISGGPNGGIKVLKGKVTVKSSTGRVKILAAASDSADEVSYTPPVIPDPAAMELRIRADEALPDISPIHS